ncbi:MAG: fructose-6-phosphate aldolase [Methanomassiliicoccales archaeon]|nr:fructose-6-phosphate aldolase [Methanomassiliicoccales archaeon]
MKIFIDSANVQQIEEVNGWGILDGVTTNPTLIAKEKTDFDTLVRQICKIVNGPISAEAISMKASDIVVEARELASIHNNIVVKIPITEEGLRATKTLSKEGVSINTTLVFSPAQALLACKAGARYISPFVGRLDDVGNDGMDVVAQILDILDNYEFDAEVIVASVRHPIHVVEAARIGAHIATVPYDVLKKMFRHPLTDIGIEKFLQDWQKVARH